MAARKQFAITVNGVKVGWHSTDDAYPTNILAELGIDDVSADTSGVFMNLNPIEMGVPRVVITYRVSGKAKSARLYCAPAKYATAIGTSSPLLKQAYKTGSIVAVRPPTRMTRT